MSVLSQGWRLSLAVCALLAMAGAGGAAAQDAALQVRALIEAEQHALLSSELAGRIARLPLEEGQAFKAGQPLVGFDCASYLAERDAARAAVRAAEVTLRQSRKLEQLKSIGAAEVELAEVKVEASRADLRKAEVLVGRCEIKAPFDGRVVERRVKEHESVAAGAPLIEVISERELRVTLIVPSAWLVWLRPGQAFDVVIDETGQHHRAEVVRTGAKVDPVSQSLKITARLLDRAQGGPLLAGMSGTARFAPVQTSSTTESVQETPRRAR